ncbi:DUF3261 domain-containing protein [Paramagnetospirillum kuznetsovii]|nr:DUF3261 domain-containing protein [Paramagnetospirillum kuznetsovii]
MRRFALCLLCVVLPGCAAAPTSGEQVLVAPGITLDLPSPADLGRSVEVVQLVTARHDGESFVFEGRLLIRPDRLVLVGSDSMGRRAMTVTWEAGKVEVERASWLPETLRPENILADIVLLYWPEAVVRNAIKGAELTQWAGNRRVGDAILVSWQGEPWSGGSRLRNIPWGYDLDIQSVTVGP